jgi:hypothetical protein
MASKHLFLRDFEVNIQGYYMAEDDFSNDSMINVNGYLEAKKMMAREMVLPTLPVSPHSSLRLLCDQRT